MRQAVLISGIGIVGLAKGSDDIIDLSFDILSLEALFLVPRWLDFFIHAFPASKKLANIGDTRICSVMSLNPYFGSLVSEVSAGDPIPGTQTKLVVNSFAS